MKVRRPAQVDPFTWEHLPHGVRLALMVRYARTPERRAALRRAVAEHSTKTLEGALKSLERLTPGGQDEQ